MPKIKTSKKSVSNKKKEKAPTAAAIAREEAWNASFQRLVEFVQLHGHCNVPTNYLQDKTLHRWVANQLTYLWDAPADNPRRRKLDSIGFDWGPVGGSNSTCSSRNFITSNFAWEQMLMRLKEYKRVNGDCNVPAYYPQDEELARWVQTQRRIFIDAPADVHRRQVLDRIGLFAWRPEEGQELTASNSESLPTLTVTRHQDLDTSPFRFKCNQEASSLPAPRQEDAGALPPQRDTGPPPQRLSDSDWDNMFQRLMRYHKKHGHCNVPYRYPQDQALGKWVASLHKNEIDLTPTQRQVLEAIGFRYSGNGNINNMSSLAQDSSSEPAAPIEMSRQSDPMASHAFAEQQRPSTTQSASTGADHLLQVHATTQIALEPAAGVSRASYPRDLAAANVATEVQRQAFLLTQSNSSGLAELLQLRALLLQQQQQQDPLLPAFQNSLMVPQAAQHFPFGFPLARGAMPGIAEQTGAWPSNLAASGTPFLANLPYPSEGSAVSAHIHPLGQGGLAAVSLASQSLASNDNNNIDIYIPSPLANHHGKVDPASNDSDDIAVLHDYRDDDRPSETAEI